MQRSFDRRSNGSVVEYISVLVCRIERSGLEWERSGLGVRKAKKKSLFKKTCTPYTFS